TSRNATDAEPVASEIRAKDRRSVALGLDVRSAASIRACFDALTREWGTIDILVNNAGTNIPTDLVTLDEQGWDTVWDPDLKRLGTAEDVAGAVVYFASTEAGFVTGQLLLVDGGTGAH